MSILPQPNPEAVQEVQRRTQNIVQSGAVPEWVFLCGVPNGLLTFQAGNPPKPVVLLFTNYFVALDYIRATKAQAEVRQLPFHSLAQIADQWKAAGVDTFVFDRCPRCTTMVTAQVETLKEREKLLFLWANRLAIRSFQGERQFRQYLQLKDSPAQARAALEVIRDHIDCSSPYLFELLAMLANMTKDEAAKAQALERLKDFGPQFADWDKRWAMDQFARSIATAMVGLGQSFGIQFKPPVTPGSRG